jgi:hypothetical protein
MTGAPWVAVVCPSALTTIIAARRPAEARPLPETNGSVKAIRALEAQLSKETRDRKTQAQTQTRFPARPAR